MKNGHCSEPSPFLHLAEHGNEPPTDDTLRFVEDCEKVRAIIRTGALDKDSMDDRYRLAWGIVRHTTGTRN
jgi:hypothetical protein